MILADVQADDVLRPVLEENSDPFLRADFVSADAGSLDDLQTTATGRRHRDTAPKPL